MTSRLTFPTGLHEEVAEIARAFFVEQPEVDSVLVVNSCARGHAIPESDLDLAVLIRSSAPCDDVQRLEQLWRAFAVVHPRVLELERAAQFSRVHVDVFDGRFTHAAWDDGGGPDTFEIEIGNRIAHAVPLGHPGPYFLQLQEEWLPFYEEELRLSRLSMVREACASDLDRLSFLLGRGLHFSALDYLGKAFKEFLQALFISRRTYPVSYTKWIREQVVDWLGAPEWYRAMPPVLSVRDIESNELAEKANALRRLLRASTGENSPGPPRAGSEE